MGIIPLTVACILLCISFAARYLVVLARSVTFWHTFANLVLQQADGFQFYICTLNVEVYTYTRISCSLFWCLKNILLATTALTNLALLENLDPQFPDPHMYRWLEAKTAVNFKYLRQIKLLFVDETDNGGSIFYQV